MSTAAVATSPDETLSPAPTAEPLTLTLKGSGEHFVFRTSARSGDGIFRFRWTLAPGKRGPPPHTHPAETETFHLESGQLKVWLDGEARTVGPGDLVVVPPQTRHRFLNEGPDPVVVEVQLDGPLQEDCLVPFAVHLAGREDPTFGELWRQTVTNFRAGAIGSGSRVMDWVLSRVADLLGLVGAEGFAPVIGWDEGGR